MRVLAIAALLISCSPEPEVPEVDPGCTGACRILQHFGCAEAKPSPGGIECVVWCSDYHSLGYMKPWADCVASSGDLDAVKSCGVVCE